MKMVGKSQEGSEAVVYYESGPVLGASLLSHRLDPVLWGGARAVKISFRLGAWICC